MMRRPRPGRPIGLRTRLIGLFALGGALLAATMALGTYLVARGYLVDQREHSATRQAFADASYVRDGLSTSGAQVSDVLGAVSPPAQSTVVVRRGSRWYSSSLDVDAHAVPAALRRAVNDGQITISWTPLRRSSAVMVGVPLPTVDAQFYELTVTSELDRTLSTLRTVLAAFAISVAVAAAMFGRWAARRVVAPLEAVAGAAARIASGALDTRLDATEDPDLATIVGSFNSMVDALDERIERDARFAADVSHELRSPLTALVTSVEVLNHRRGELSAGSRQVLDLIMGDLARFQRVLEDLLELGRLEAGAIPRVISHVDARDLARHTLQDSGRPATLLRLTTNPAEVEVDKQQVARALLNLFENADRHGNGLTAVTVDRTVTDVLITIEDHGPGVQPADRERIFARFVRGGARRSHPGAGLGLSLVAETLRAHGGAVWCSENNGGGARFTMRLPRAGPGTADD